MVRSRSAGIRPSPNSIYAMRWSAAIQLHDDAAARYLEQVEALSVGRWSVPIAEGKWTPAEVTQHLIQAYEILLTELRGGPGMRIRTRWWQRALLRTTLVPRLLRGAAFPAGARAPRETRPDQTPGSREDLLQDFRRLAREFREATALARQEQKGARLTHAYFGASSVREGVILCARHIEHHTAHVREIED